MKCPHCTNSVSFRSMLTQSLHCSGDLSIDEEIFCPLCQKRIYWSVRPTVIFFGSLLALFGLSKLDRLLMQIVFVIPAYTVYIFISAMIVIIFSLKLRSKPSVFSIMEASFSHKIHFVSSYFLLPMVIVQICVLYMNIIPLRQNLTEINDTIVNIYRNTKGFPTYLLLNKQGPNKKYLFFSSDDFENEWSDIKKLSINAKVHILVDESTSVTEDSYRIWEMEDDSKVILPYEAMKKIRQTDANEANWIQVKFTIVFALFYFITLYFKRKADRKLKSNSLEQKDEIQDQ